MDLVFYNGEHSVVFGEKHSWLDWHLIPTAAFVVPPPKARTEFIDIPGANGQLDVSEILTGFPTYENRSGSFSFIYIPENCPPQAMYQRLSNYLHGKRMQVVLTDEPDYYYQGRVSIREFSRGGSYSNIAFDYQFDPFKFSVLPIAECQNLRITANETKEIDIFIGNGPIRETPLVTSTAPYTVVLESETASTAKTINVVQSSVGIRYPNLVLGPGQNHLSISGTVSGTISFEARRGSL